MTLLRTHIPELKSPEKFTVPRAENRILDNGLSIYVINTDTEPVVKLELIFPSGTTGSSDFAIASATQQLLDSGTRQKSAPEIAEAFDYYGSYLQTDFGPDWKSISLFSLTRFLPDTLPTLIEVMQNASFPESELENWKTRSIQALRVNLEKVSWLAKTEFNEALFGKDHPYGYTINEDAVRNLDATVLREFFSKNYFVGSAIIIISGNVTEQVMKNLNDTLGKIPVNGIQTQQSSSAIAPVVPLKKLVPKKDAVQSGIRIGKILFSKNHPDFPALQIANTILGGYFGSRLMSNIREDKGYTYGIGSGIHPFRNSGFFFISTEVGNEVRDAAIHEIYAEIKRLAEEPVGQQELQLVKNYLIGAFQRSIDGPFALADRFKGLKLYGLDYDYIENYLSILKNIGPQAIMDVVAEHLQIDSMTEIIAG